MAGSRTRLDSYGNFSSLPAGLEDGATSPSIHQTGFPPVSVPSSIPESPAPPTPTQQLQMQQPINLLSSKTVLPSAPMRPPRPNLPEPLRRRNCNPKIMRCTLNAIPENPALLSKSKLPLGLHVFPFGFEAVPVIESTVITRCRNCRTYINPFVTFLSQGRRWRCNMCLRIHDVPADFDYDPVRREPVERSERAELMSATVEYIAPSEYMVRPPQPCVYLFLIDASTHAIASGLIKAICDTLLELISEMTGDSRDRKSVV